MTEFEAFRDATYDDRPVKITVSDPETGEVLGEKVIRNDYMLICAGRRYLKHVQAMGRTHMLAVAEHKPGEGRERSEP